MSFPIQSSPSQLINGFFFISSSEPFSRHQLQEDAILERLKEIMASLHKKKAEVSPGAWALVLARVKLTFVDLFLACSESFLPSLGVDVADGGDGK